MQYKFHKVYIELTNICGLHCSFCPTKTETPRVMEMKTFEKILQQLKPFTKNIALHVFGDPLTVKNLVNYLDLALQYNFKVDITTTGYYLKKFDLNLFLHPTIKQINFSLNSYNKNEMKISLEEYLSPMFELCDLKLHRNIHHFINFRLWNLDSLETEKKFNADILKLLAKQFSVALSNITYDKPIRLENQILINFDHYFQWPNLETQKISNGFCHGLSSQIAILSSGEVVPCCLDSFGKIDLGNIHKKTLKQILYSEKSLNIVNGFKNNIAVEELCQKCTFKERFN